MIKKFTALATTTALAAGVVLLGTPPASADTAYGCVYPRVCFYLTDSDFNADKPTAAYQDITSYYQTLGSRSRGANWVLNTRNDDRAWIRYTYGGQTYYACLDSQWRLAEFTDDATVTGIKIENTTYCP